jgi:hypothetical protein
VTFREEGGRVVANGNPAAGVVQVVSDMQITATNTFEPQELPATGSRLLVVTIAIAAGLICVGLVIRARVRAS